MSDSPQVFALAPDWPHPSGGVRKIYRHVDVLNAHGISATVLHQKRDFRVTWFENRTPVAFGPDVRPREKDCLLVPEQVAAQALGHWPGVRKVVFNQNAYESFVGHNPGVGELQTPYRHPDFVATIVVSEDSRRYLNYAFPNHSIFRIHYGIDSQLFHFEPRKKPQIACMPRKNGKDLLQVLAILRARKATEGLTVLGIQNTPEAQTARHLRESMVFFSFGGPEGFGLPPAEAMACGCAVVGYHGQGGREFMTPQYSFPIEFGDIIGYATAAEDVLRRLRDDPQPLLDKARRASQFILDTYTLHREEEDIVNVWQQILGSGLPHA